jgi:hypothetical protein
MTQGSKNDNIKRRKEKQGGGSLLLTPYVGLLARRRGPSLQRCLFLLLFSFSAAVLPVSFLSGAAVSYGEGREGGRPQRNNEWGV